MNRKRKKKPPDRDDRPQSLPQPGQVPHFRGDVPESPGDVPGFRPLNVGRSFPHGRYAAAAVCALLLLAVALVFGQTAQQDFIRQYDDADYILENPQVARGVTVQGIVWAFTHFRSNNWHPLTWLSHMLDCQFYGLKHPGGHHLTNVLLHAASVLLLFLVLRQMTGDLWPSAFTAALFAIHPLHVESVAWVAERKDVLSGLFFMLTLAAYTGYARRPFSLLRYLLVTGLLALGLMAKPMLVTLPFVLLLLDYWPLRRHVRPSWLIVEKLPWLALAAASCVMTYLAQGTAVISAQRLLLQTRIANALVSCVAYLGQFFYPVGLAVYYPHWQSHLHYALPLGNIFGSLVLLAGISLTVLACRRKCPYLPVGWLWYLGMLVPVIGLVQVGGQAMADRYTYLTQIGLYVAIAWGAAHVVGAWPYCRWPFAAVSALMLAGLMSCSWQQTQYWRDSEALWTHTLACTQQNRVAHNNLGVALASRGEFDKAIRQYQTALDIEPGFAEAHNNLGLALAGRGDVDKAIAQYQTALELKPDFAEAHNNLGHALAKRAEAYGNLGNVLLRRGLLAEAIADYQKALEIKPDFAEVYNSLGTAEALCGRMAEAIADYQKALEIKPDYVAVLNNMAWIRATHGDPKFRDGPQAVRLARRAVELSSSNANSLNTLAAAYAEAGMFAEAVQTARKALDLAKQPGKPAIQAKLRLYEAGTPYHESPAETPMRP